MKRGFPIKQLETRHYLKWDGVNVQEAGLEPPKEDEDTLALYMVDIETKASKRFTLTASLSELLQRKITHVAYGTTNELNGKQVKIVIQWETEVRLGAE